MAEVIGVTKARVQEIEDASIVGAAISNRDLVFTTGDGSEINAGRVIPLPYESWPIGSIFMNINPTNPATLLGGGTWVRWGKGRVPVSIDESQTEFDEPSKTGGSKTHVLTTAEMPKHSHGGTTGTRGVNHTHTGTTSTAPNHDHTMLHYHENVLSGAGAQLKWETDKYAAGSLSGVGTGGASMLRTSSTSAETTGDAGAHSHTFTTGGTPDTVHDHAISQDGGGGAHNNIQPYITCYMWIRTA